MLPDDVQTLLHQVLQILVAPFQGHQSHSNVYPILEKSLSASFQYYHNHMEVQRTKQMEWLVLVSRAPVGRILMAILLYDLESLLYTVSMVCIMDLKSYRSESPQHQFRIFKSRFLQAAEVIIYDNLLPEQGTAVFPAHEI